MLYEISAFPHLYSFPFCYSRYSLVYIFLNPDNFIAYNICYLYITKAVEVAEVCLLNQLWHCRISDGGRNALKHIKLGESFTVV